MIMRAAMAGAALLGAAAAWPATVTFEKLEFAGKAEHGVFAADLDGDREADLIALGRGEIAIYRHHKSPPQYRISPELLSTASLAYFADVADVLPAPGQELLLLTPNGVACFVHGEDGRYVPRPQTLLDCETLLTSRPLRGAVGRAALRFSIKVLPWNFAFDADGDGRDDVLVPHGGGTDVYLQQAQRGTFDPAITLPLFPYVLHSVPLEPGVHDLVGAKAKRIRLTLELLSIERHDVNGDRKPDLVCGRQWFAQKQAGGFDTTPAEAPAELRPDPDRPMFDIRADLNADGHPDRIHADNRLDDPLNIVTRVRYFLADAQGRVPRDRPTGVVVGQNILIHSPLPVHDFNSDGLLDFALFDTDIRVTEIAKWLRQSFGEIEGDLNFWFFDRGQNGYPRRASYRKSIHMSFKVDLMDAMAGYVWERYLGTMMRFEGDFNADGRPDLLVRETTHTLALYFNTGHRTDLFPSRPSVTLERVPAFGGLDVADLNGDGASDLVLYTGTSALAPNPTPNDVIAIYVTRLR